MAPRNTHKQCNAVLADRGDFKMVLKNCSMFPEWIHAVPESAYFKVPERLNTFHMYSLSRFVYVLHCLATRLRVHLCEMMWVRWPAYLRYLVIGLLTPRTLAKHLEHNNNNTSLFQTSRPGTTCIDKHATQLINTCIKK